MRCCLVGSTGWFGSVYSPSRLPLPLVSTISAVQPCDFCSSPVSRNILVLSQPTTLACGPPALVHSVSFLSYPNCRWCVGKQVLISVNLPLLRSSIASWRPEVLSGNSLADSTSESFLQKSGLLVGRMRAVNQTLPSSSYIGLCTM